MQCEYNDMEEFLDSLTINSKYFDGDPIISHKSSMEQLSNVAPYRTQRSTKSL